MIKKNQSLSSFQIFKHFIHGTVLAKDYKGWGIFSWPESRWSVGKIAKLLVDNGMAKPQATNIKTGEILSVWAQRDIDPEEIVKLCLTEKELKKLNHKIRKGLV